MNNMDAQGYYDSLLAQGYTSEDATKYTQEHYPEFGQAAVAPAPMPIPAPGEMPAPAPMLMPTPSVAMQDSVISGDIHQNITDVNQNITTINYMSVVAVSEPFLDAFGFELTTDLESSLSTLSLMWLLVMFAAVGLIGVSISQFVNTPWAVKALFATNGALLILLFITGYLEYSFVLELDEDISLFETNGLFLSYCTGICFATFALFAFLGRRKNPPVLLQN